MRTDLPPRVDNQGPGKTPWRTTLVALDARVARAWGLEGLAYAPAGAVLVNGQGAALRVREDGGLDQLIQGGLPHGGIAADPTATGVRSASRPAAGGR